MVPTGRVRDRANARPRSGDGGNDFVGLVPAKWWGPVVLDAAPKAPSCLATLRENLPTSQGAATIGIAVCPLETPRRHGKIESGGVQRPDRKDPDYGQVKAQCT